MISSQQVDVVWVSDLESHQEANGLERVVSSINKVAKEQVIVGLNVASLVRRAPQIEEAHQILVLAVDIAENFHWCINLENHGLSLDDLLRLIGKCQDVLPPEREVRLAINGRGPLLGSQQVVQE